MKKTLYLRDLLPFISYGVTLQIMEFSLTKRNCIVYGRSIRAVGVSIIRLAEIRNRRGNAVVGNGLSNGSWSSGREVE